MWAMTKPWSNMFGSVIRVSFFPIRIRLLRPAAATFSAPVSWEPGGDSWKADAMVRYDTAVQREMVLSGMNEVTDEFIPLETPVLGKWFVLPSSRITGTVSVYIEDENGPLRDDSARVKNRRWRKLNPAEFTIHGIEGILELEFDTTSTVAVVYDGAWSAGGTAGDELTDFISETRAWFESSTQALPEEYLPDPDDPSYRDDCAERYILGVDGNESLVVQERGYFSPFSLASRYRSYGTRLEIIHRETEKLVDIVAVQEFGTEFAEVFRTDGNAPSNGSSRYRSPSSRFPLAPEQPLMYLPAGGGRNTDTSLVIRSRTHTPIGTISLGENAIPGTIQIVRNGITDNSFTYDESSSLLTLVRPPQPGETIRITWMDSETSARNATLTMAAGIAWNATDRLDFSLASALSGIFQMTDTPALRNQVPVRSWFQPEQYGLVKPLRRKQRSRSIFPRMIPPGFTVFSAWTDRRSPPSAGRLVCSAPAQTEPYWAAAFGGPSSCFPE